MKSMKHLGRVTSVLFLCGVVCLFCFAQSSSMPRLTIESSPGPSVRLTSTNDGTQLVLQSADSLKTPIAWQAAAGVPTTENKQFSITLDVAAQSSTSDLRHPGQQPISTGMPPGQANR
jgi:hypothetical protein